MELYHQTSANREVIPGKTLSGRKTQTRRVLKPQILDEWEPWPQSLEQPEWYTPGIVDKEGELQPADHEVFGCSTWDGEHGWTCPYGAPGDRLWVRETYRLEKNYDRHRPVDVSDSRVWYEADQGVVQYRGLFLKGRKRPSIHMPRWASRITLEITDIRVERVQHISEEDMIAEGLPALSYTANIEAWADLWDAINARRGHGWEVNPWVWVIQFKRVQL